MKVVALIPFRNEARLLPLCLASLQGVADLIVGMDDNSADNSARIAAEAGAVVLSAPPHDLSSFTEGKESSVRQMLLEEGRRQGGTHFLCVDADEALSANFRQHARMFFEGMEPGHKLALRWQHLWGSPWRYRDGDYSKFHRVFHIVAVCDAPGLRYEKKYLHMPRTPGPDSRSLVHKLREDEGCLLHFNAVALRRYGIKVAWYFCSELNHAPDDAVRINRAYGRDFDLGFLRTKALRPEWIEGLPIPADLAEDGPGWQWDELMKLFDQRGIEFFERLEMWHIPDLRAEFIRRTGREPRDLTPFFEKTCCAARRLRKRFNRLVVDVKRKVQGQA